MTSKQFPATFEPNLEAKSDEQREAILADPGFGNHFTDHMFLAEWTPDTGWSDARVVPYGPLSLDPATAVLHYAQEVFEGLKAYIHEDGSVWLFRPEANAARMQRSAHRLALPELPIDWFLGSIESLIEADRAWVPAGEEKSLYIRPFMFASEVFLGVRPSQHVTYSVIASPAGAYFAGGVKAVSIWLQADADVILKRVKRRADRPLLQTEDPAATISRLLDVLHLKRIFPFELMRRIAYLLPSSTGVFGEFGNQAVVQRVDWTRTRAFALAQGPIYINRINRDLAPTEAAYQAPVSYTHLTLPTIYPV